MSIVLSRRGLITGALSLLVAPEAPRKAYSFLWARPAGAYVFRFHPLHVAYPDLVTIAHLETMYGTLWSQRDFPAGERWRVSDTANFGERKP